MDLLTGQHLRQLGDSAAQIKSMVCRGDHYRTLLQTQLDEWKTWTLSYSPFRYKVELHSKCTFQDFAISSQKRLTW